MKIATTTLSSLAQRITPLDTRERRDSYLKGEYVNAPAQDLDKRYRWDLLHDALAPSEVCDWLYGEGLNDTHIETALRQIVMPLGGPTPTSPDREALSKLDAYLKENYA